MSDGEIIVFVGPTLPREEAAHYLRAVFRAPVAQGDVLLAVRSKPFALAIIDGYFERLPAVWHKEILWALSQGVHVWGAGSMGALRAAELASFGMRGIGHVYEAFQSGALEDDDEVAVAHADEAADFRAGSEAMVNIRATLECAEREGVITRATRTPLQAIAKRLFYPDRTYPAILGRGRAEGLRPDELAAFASFLGQGRVNVKADDARLMLAALAKLRAENLPPPDCSFTLAHTDAWEHLANGGHPRG